MNNNHTYENRDPNAKFSAVDDDYSNQEPANLAPLNMPAPYDQLHKVTIPRRQDPVLQTQKAQGSAVVHIIEQNVLQNESYLDLEDYQFHSQAQLTEQAPSLVKRKSAMFGQNTASNRTETQRNANEEQQDNTLLDQERMKYNYDPDRFNINQPENMTQDKLLVINPTSSQSLSCDESLRCQEVVEELKINQTQLQQIRNAQISTKENESLINQRSKGAKNNDVQEKHFQRPQQPFINVGVKMMISPNIPKDKLKSLTTFMEQHDSKAHTGAVAVASPSPNYNDLNNKTKLSSDAIAAKDLINQSKSLEMDSLQIQSRQFSFYQKSLSPHIVNKSVLESHRSDRMMENQFDSPEKTNKIMYNVDAHSGNKIKDIINSPFHKDKFSFLHHTMLSHKKQNCSPMRQEHQLKGLISAPHLIGTKQKGRFCSPNNLENNGNHDENISENDARFSSNTTERYRTRCSKGSVIHSNFKINQNSLQKQPKSKVTQQVIQYDNSNSARMITKQISFAPNQDMVVMGQQAGIQNSALSTPNLNLSYKQKLKFEDEEAFSVKRQNQNHSSLFNNDSQNLINIGNFAQNLSTSKFGYNQTAFSPNLMGENTNNSPAFANPLIQANINKQIKSCDSKSSDQDTEGHHCEQIELPTPLFAQNKNQNSVFNQQKYTPYPSMLRVGGPIISPAKRVKGEQFSSQKIRTSESSSGSGSSEESSEGSSSICSDSSSKKQMNMFNMSSQSQTYKYDQGLFAQMDGVNPCLGNGAQDQIMYNKCQNMAGFNQWHPYLQQAFIKQQIVQEHQHNLQQQFNFVSPQEIAHHSYHSAHGHGNHIPGCTLKCSCGLLNMTADQFFFPKDKMASSRSRAESDFSMKSPQKQFAKHMNMFHCAQLNSSIQNFYQGSIPPFANMSANFAAMNAFMNPPMPDLINQTTVKVKKDSHKKKRMCGKKRAPEDDISAYNTEQKRKKTCHESENGQNEVLRTPKNKQMKMSNNSTKFNLNTQHNDRNADSVEWSGKHKLEAQGSQMLVMNSRIKKSKISRTQTKKCKDQFDAPDAIFPSKDFNDEETPQKHSDFLLMNEKGRKKSQHNTQLNTMDTMNRNSYIKNNQFNLEISPASKFDAKFNSSMKENLQHNLFDKEPKQIHFTNDKKMHQIRSDHADSVGINGFSHKRGHSVSKISIQEKEQLNQKNEEQIRIMTDRVMAMTLTQDQFFKKIQDQEPRVQQCMGCKCKNTKCLKLYCECLRNKATCGPACQCKQQPKTANDVCNNNDDFVEKRRNAIRDILKRNILAFEDKVSKDQHFKGCKCKNSFCQKKYCECYERNVACTSKCKCVNCKNDGPCPTHNDSARNQLTVQNEQDSMYIRDQFTGVQFNNEKSEGLMNSELNNQGLSTNVPELPNQFQQRHFDLDQELFYNEITPIINDVKPEDQQSVKKSQILDISMDQLASYVDEKSETVLTKHQSNKNMIDFGFQPPFEDNTIKLEKKQENEQVFENRFDKEENIQIQLVSDKKFPVIPSVPSKLTSFNVSSQVIENAHIPDSRDKHLNSRKEVEPDTISNYALSKKSEKISYQATSSVLKGSKRSQKQATKKEGGLQIVKKSSAIKQGCFQLINKQSTMDKLTLKASKESVAKKQTTIVQVKKQATGSTDQQQPKIVTRQSKRIREQQLKQQPSTQHRDEEDENHNPNSRQAM